jgi:hypothetical protein
MADRRLIGPICAIAVLALAAPAGAQTATVEYGRTALVQPVSGSVEVDPRGYRGAFTLQRTTRLPIGSRIDATNGEVRLITARSKRGGRTRGVFSEGAFVVKQPKRGTPVTELVLTGGEAVDCPAPGGARPMARTAVRRRVRSLRGRSNGGHRTRGRHAAGNVRGTVWRMEDRCEGTLTEVEEGAVQVGDLGRSVRVENGGSFLAWCTETGDYCKNVEAEGGDFRLRIGSFGFTGQYALCIRAPDGVETCRTFTLRRGRFDIFASNVSWRANFPDAGPGVYQARWELPSSEGGPPTVLGPVLPFTVR